MIDTLYTTKHSLNKRKRDYKEYEKVKEENGEGVVEGVSQISILNRIFVKQKE